MSVKKPAATISPLTKVLLQEKSHMFTSDVLWRFPLIVLFKFINW